MENFYKNKKILVTGGAGTVGKVLLKKLLKFNPKELVVIDNNESEVFFLQEEFKNENFRAYVADISNKDLMFNLLNGIDYVFHTAALKHVILGEKCPESIVNVNIIGIQNLIDAAIFNKVEKFLFTSSDKAVNPTNVMGTSKLMGERLVTAANNRSNSKDTVFCSTRFGNVIGSRGSVFPIFKNQIASGGPITLTNKEMTRFIMTIEESVDLIMESCMLAKGGEVFVTKMPVIRIEDLALAMRDELNTSDKDIEIVEIGAKAGEKLYEELMTEEETSRAYELNNFFVILPAFKAEYASIDFTYLNLNECVKRAYVSSKENVFSVGEIKEYLYKNKLL